MVDWENPQNLFIEGNGTTITIPPGETTPYLIARQFNHVLQDRPFQIIEGYEVRTRLKVINGDPQDLKECNIEISPNYNVYAENKADPTNSYSNEVTEHIYGSETDKWYVKSHHESLYHNPFIGICVRYENMGTEPLTIELLNLNLQVYSKSMIEYKGKNIEPEVITCHVDVGLYFMYGNQKLTFDTGRQGHNIGSGDKTSSSEVSWTNPQNIVPDDSSAFVNLEKGKKSAYAKSRRWKPANLPLHSKITSIQAVFHNVWGNGVKGAYEVACYLMSHGNDGFGQNLSSGKIIPNTNQNGKYLTFNYNNTGVVTPSIYNNSSFGSKINFINKSTGKIQVRVGAAYTQCSYKLVDEDRIIVNFTCAVSCTIHVGESYKGAGLFLTAGEIASNLISKKDNDKPSNQWDVHYKVILGMIERSIGINENWKADVKRLNPFIGPVELEHNPRIESAEVTVADSEVYNQFRGAETHSKKGEAKETKPLLLYVQEKQVMPLKALPQIDEIFPVYTTPNLDDNDPLVHRGYANIWSVKGKWLNQLQSDVDIELRYITKELYPSLLMDYTKNLISEDSVLIIPTNYELIVNGYDYQTIDENTSNNPDNTIPFSVIEDNGEVFTLKSNNSNQNFAEFITFAEVEPGFKFSTALMFKNNNNYQNSEFSYLFNNIEISISVDPDDYSSHIIRVSGLNGMEQYKSVGSVGYDVNIKGNIRLDGKSKIEVVTATDVMVFRPIASLNSENAIIRMKNESFENQFYPSTILLRELIFHKTTYAEGITVEQHNVVCLPPQTKQKAEQDFYRDSADGNIPCYVNPTEALHFKLNAYHFYRGSVKAESKEGTRILNTDFVIKNKEIITISNGVTKIIISRLKENPEIAKIEYYGFMSGWELITNFYIENVFDVQFNHINSEDIDIRVGQTYWRMTRGKAFVNIRNPNDIIRFDMFDFANFATEDNVIDSISIEDTLEPIPLEHLFFATFEYKDRYAAMQILYKIPGQIKATELPPSELTGIGWYMIGATGFEHYANKAVEWLNTVIQKITLAIDR